VISEELKSYKVTKLKRKGGATCDRRRPRRVRSARCGEGSDWLVATLRRRRRGIGWGCFFPLCHFKILIEIRSEVELIEQRAGDPPSRKASIYAKAAT